jgi:perosamine synthetase
MNPIKACDCDIDVDKTIAKVNEVLRSGWVSGSGPVCKQFEEKVANYHGMKHGISCSSGTAAIHLALAGMGITRGDEVIMSAFAPIFCSNPVFWCGARPVLVDVDSDTLCIDANKIEERITPKTKAIMAIHMYGHSCDMDAIDELADAYGLEVLEDAAEAHGAMYKNKKCGSMGDVSIFSYYSNKLTRSGCGGMVLTNDDDIVEEVWRLRSHYSGEGEWKFKHDKIGFNYRLSDVLAAIGLVDMDRLDANVQARRKNANLYLKYLHDMEGIKLPVERFGCFNTYWMYNIIFDIGVYKSLNRQEVMNHMAGLGIETRPSFFPVHWQPCYGDYFIGESYPVSEYVGLYGMNLPSGNMLTEEQIEYIVDNLKDALK